MEIRQERGEVEIKGREEGRKGWEGEGEAGDGMGLKGRG